MNSAPSPAFTLGQQLISRSMSNMAQTALIIDQGVEASIHFNLSLWSSSRTVCRVCLVCFFVLGGVAPTKLPLHPQSSWPPSATPRTQEREPVLRPACGSQEEKKRSCPRLMHGTLYRPQTMPCLIPYPGHSRSPPAAIVIGYSFHVTNFWGTLKG